MKKKVFAVALSLIMVLALCTACGNSSSSGSSSGSSDSLAASDGGKSVADMTTFTVGFDAEYPPFGYKDDNGDYTGFDLELAQAVCDLEGWKLVKNPIDWDSKDMELNSGSIDCIWNGFTINGRENDYTWSVPYCDNSQVVVVPAGSDIKKLSDLKGKVVGVQTASAAYDVLTNKDQQKDLGDTFAQLQQFGDYNTAFTELKAGSIDALAIDVGVANYQIKQRGDGFVKLDEALNSEQYGVGFKKGNTALRDEINKDLKKLKEDGTVDKLAQKYDIADMICL